MGISFIPRCVFSGTLNLVLIQPEAPLPSKLAVFSKKNCYGFKFLVGIATRKPFKLFFS